MYTARGSTIPHRMFILIIKYITGTYLIQLINIEKII